MAVDTERLRSQAREAARVGARARVGNSAWGRAYAQIRWAKVRAQKAEARRKRRFDLKAERKQQPAPVAEVKRIRRWRCY